MHRGRVAGRGRGRPRTGTGQDGERGGAGQQAVATAPEHSQLHTGTLKGHRSGTEHPQGEPSPFSGTTPGPRAYRTCGTPRGRTA
ncbi:hypothetical protein GCM10010425_84850 [Streptomyces spororaveus]